MALAQGGWGEPGTRSHVTAGLLLSKSGMRGSTPRCGATKGDALPESRTRPMLLGLPWDELDSGGTCVNVGSWWNGLDSRTAAPHGIQLTNLQLSIRFEDMRKPFHFEYLLDPIQ